ncbi:hypothetical protein EC988_001187 [Linderina pennispora]|nr:hypothetical protein EC988_001187 [Linderina pennispora]
MHEFVRSEVIGQILHRVAFQNDSHTVCLDLLGKLVEDDPDAVGKYWSKVMDVFDSISVLDAQTVESLIKAVLPILVDEAPFRSSLLLVIRKILFAHNIEDRHKALAGLFAMIAEFSEAAQECGGGRQADLLSSVLLEMVGLLRRCFTQQAEVRARAYEGLSALFERNSVNSNAMLLNALHSIFRVEFAKYYEGISGFDSPINIQKCLNPSTHKSAMPIGSFLQCYSKLTSAQTDLLGQNEAGSSKSATVANESCDQLRDLCVRFAKAEMEDFELDPTGDYSISSPSALRNHNTIRLVIGCLDSCFEYVAMHSVRGNCSCTIDNPDIALQLYMKYAQFADTLCTRCLDDKNKRIITHPAELSLVTIESAIGLLQLILPDRQRQDDEQHPMNEIHGHDWFVERAGRAIAWSASQPLVRHLLETALLRIPGARVEQVLELAYTVYSGVIIHTASECDDMPAYLKPKQAKGRTTMILSCEVLAACASTLKDRNMLGLLAFAILNPSAVCFSQTTTPSRPQMAGAAAALVASLQRSASTLLGQRPIATKDAVVVIGVIQSLNEWLVGELPGLDGSDQQHTYTALNGLARWTASLLGGELPSDLGLLKALFLLITAVQAHLQPADTALAQYSADTQPAAANDQTDAAELGEISHFIDRMGMAFQTLQGEEVDDEAMDQDDLDLFLPRTFAPLLTLLAGWAIIG